MTHSCNKRHCSISTVGLRSSFFLDSPKSKKIGIRVAETKNAKISVSKLNLKAKNINIKWLSMAPWKTLPLNRSNSISTTGLRGIIFYLDVPKSGKLDTRLPETKYATISASKLNLKVRNINIGPLSIAPWHTLSINHSGSLLQLACMG